MSGRGTENERKQYPYVTRDDTNCEGLVNINSRLKENIIILAISLNHTVFPTYLFMAKTEHTDQTSILNNTKQTPKQMIKIFQGTKVQIMY